MSEPVVEFANRERKPLSARTRFEVFKRDRFTCQYCGAHPPGVLLHVDHIVAVANGGTNAQSNLVTACDRCNLGKAAVPLGKVKPNLKQQAEDAREREKQIRGYQRLIDAAKQRLEREVDEVEEVFAQFHDGYSFTPRFRISVRLFLEKLGLPAVSNAMERACARIHDRSNATKYFCGICWKLIREAGAE